MCGYPYSFENECTLSVVIPISLPSFSLLARHLSSILLSFFIEDMFFNVHGAMKILSIKQDLCFSTNPLTQTNAHVKILIESYLHHNTQNFTSEIFLRKLALEQT
jgi:hypothetical protein